MDMHFNKTESVAHEIEPVMKPSGTSWLRRMGSLFQGIHSRLTGLFLILSLCPLLIAGLLAFQNGKESLETNIGLQLENDAERILRELQSTMTAGEASLSNWTKLTVMQDLTADDPDGRITGTLITLARESSSLGQLLAVSPGGLVVAASQPNRIGERVSGTDWFKMLKSQDTISGHWNLFDAVAEQGRFHFALGVLSSGKQPRLIGYLVSTMKVDRLEEILASKQETLMGARYLLDRTGHIFSPQARAQEGSIEAGFGSTFLRFLDGQQSAKLAPGIKGWVVWSAESGEQLVGYVQSLTGPTAGATIVAMKPTEQAFAPIRELRRQFVLIGLVLALLILLISKIVAGRLSRPINTLTSSAEAVAAGRFEQVELPLTRTDEIGALSRSFQRMTDELKKLTEDLEERVRERTVELDRANRSLQEQIQEREVAEAAVRASERRFHQMVSEVKDYAIIMLDLQGTVVHWNEGAQRIKGYREDEIIGKSFSCFYTADDVAAGIPAQFMAQALQEGSAEIEGWRLRKDGSRFWAYVTLTALHDEQQQLIGFSKLTRDLTAQKSAEAEKHVLEAQLLQAQKMEAVGQLAGGIAHDFNNLLTVVTGYCQMGLSSLQPNQPLYVPMQEISKAADRAAGLTRQLLAFSRKQMLQPTVLSLNEIVAEMDHMLRPLIGEHIDLKVAHAGDLEQVKVDRSQIQQIILNLAVNAKDAMPKGGRLIIRTGNMVITPARREETGIVPPGRYVTLEVRDTGCGMDAATKKRVFEPFFTTKEVGKGTGLGLATVYGITKQSGGYVTVVSEVGQGASFTIYLPSVLHDAQPEAKAIVAPSGPAPQGDGATILLVEDESGIRRLLQGLLASNGYNVLTAGDGEAGVIVGSSYRGQIDLLVTDVVMPKMSGADMAKILMDKRKNLKVLYMSGYTDESIVHHGVLEPGIAFLAKPFTPEALVQRVHDVLKV
jgi:PAS domain S-box-containing protein